MNTPKIAVFVSGGVVQEIVTDSDINVAVIDMDTDGASDEELNFYPDDDGNQNSAYIAINEITTKDPEYVSRLFKAIE